MFKITTKKTAIITLLALLLLLPTLSFSGDKLHKAAYNGDIELVKTLLQKK